MVEDVRLPTALVSVVMPVYNAEKFLRRSVDSVLAQTYASIELILVNDGSMDASEDICRQYAQANSRVQVISQKNMGPAAARNTGVRHAAGEYVFFLDADDWIDASALELMVKAYDHPDIDLVMSNFCKLEMDGAIVLQPVSFHPGGDVFTGKACSLAGPDIVDYVRHFFQHPSNHPVSYCWARLYKTGVIREHHIRANEGMRLFEDFVFNLEYLQWSRRVVFLNQPLYTYVMHDTHRSASMKAMHAQGLLHDMGIFKSKAVGFLVRSGVPPVAAVRETGHTLVHYAIIFLVRSCRWLAQGNWHHIAGEIREIVRSPLMKESLEHYRPFKGRSRFLAIFMRWQWVTGVMLLARVKAYQRYGRPRRV